MTFMKNLSKHISFSRSPGSEGKHRLSDADALLPNLEETDQNEFECFQKSLSWRTNPETIIRVALAFFTLSTFLLLVAYLSKHPTDEQCGRQLSIWSPLSDAVKYEEMDFVNKAEQPSVYRGAPTHKLEEEWEKLWFYGALSIPESKLHLLNRSRNEPWDPHPDKKGYRALIEVFHQLHCLDVIRQYTYREYYPQHPENVSIPFLLAPDMAPLARQHADHCIEALRLANMCHGDVTPYLLETSANAPTGVDPDFSPHHKCVKFEPLVAYMNKQKFRPESHNPHR